MTQRSHLAAGDEATWLPEESVQRESPRNLSSSDRHLFERELTGELPAVSLYRYSDAVVADSQWIRSRGTSVPLGLGLASLKRRLYERVGFETQRLLHGKSGDVFPTALWITDGGFQTFFHWFTEALPRLVALESFLVSENDPWTHDRIVLLPGVYETIPYVRESISCCSVNPYYLRRPATAKVDRLLYSERIAPTGNYRPSSVAETRTKLIECLSRERPPNEPGLRRLYVSRSGASRRRVINESQVIDMLHNYGFETVRFEELSLAEAVSLVRDADIICGLHGAGLTNMMWMLEGKTVVELRLAGDAHNNCYFALASALSLRYYYLLTEPADHRDAARSDIHSVDVELNLSDLQRVVSQALKGARS